MHLCFLKKTSISLLFKTAVGYGPGYVLAVSTGDVIEIGSDEDGSYAIQKINNNGTEFYAKYTGISLLTCEEGADAGLLDQASRILLVPRSRNRWYRSVG